MSPASLYNSRYSSNGPINKSVRAQIIEHTKLEGHVAICVRFHGRSLEESLSLGYNDQAKLRTVLDTHMGIGRFDVERGNDMGATVHYWYRFEWILPMGRDESDVAVFYRALSPTELLTLDSTP